MTPTPTGNLVRTPDGQVLTMSRTFRAPIDDVWASLTESERTSRWIGPWTGEGAPGKTALVTMSVEDGADPSPVTIRSCDPPRGLGLDIGFGGGGVWSIIVELSENNGVTTVELRHSLSEEDDVSDIGPGWEYYFDRLVTAETGGEMRPWDDYYPAQKEYYEEAKIVES